MYQVKCIEKIRDKHNNIVEYKLIGKGILVTSVKPDDLKEFIRSGQIEVINLTLTSDNRLIDKKSAASSKPNINTESLLNRLKSIGYIINTFDTDCGHRCYTSNSQDNTKHLLIIPDDVEYIYGSSDDINDNKLHKYMVNIKGALKVIGGKGLVSAYYMFHCCSAQFIDLSSFDTSKVTDMYGMFWSCKAQSIDLTSFDTSNVTDMESMFSGCTAKSIDLRSFKTGNVLNMGWMFEGCIAQSINLTSFDTRNVTTMEWMFSRCKAQSLDLTSFDTSNVTDMNNMFKDCSAQYINLSLLNTSNATDMHGMFFACKAQSLDLRSFVTSNVTNIDNMFTDCKAQINVTDPKLKYQLQRDRR